MLAEGILFTVFELVISVESFIFLSLLLISLALSTIYGTGKNFRGGNWYYESAPREREEDPVENEKNKVKSAPSLKKKKTVVMG